MASELICIEVFCGKARLSQSLKALSFQTFSIDHKALKNVAILRLDLNSPLERKLLQELIDQGNILYVHFAPPCGTASAARNIRMSRRNHGPPPLRSLDRPMGLEKLSSINKERVRLANNLYTYTCFFIRYLHERGIKWSIENPSSSLMWITDPFRDLAADLRKEFFGLVLDTCMFGASRLKHTAIWTCVDTMHQLARRCDGSHTHEPWGKVGSGFATALECAYNKELSDAWAACIKDYAIQQGVVFPPTTLYEVKHGNTKLCSDANKGLLGVQPRGKKIPPIMTDLLQADSFDITSSPQLHNLVPGCRLPGSCDFPPGSRLLRYANTTGGEANDTVDAKHCARVQRKAIIGVPRPPNDYLAEVLTLQHPHNMDVLLDEGTTKAMKLQLEGDGTELRATRITWAKYVNTLCSELRIQEEDLHRKLPPHLSSVLASKKLLVFERLLGDIDYADAKVAKEMADGFGLVGWAPKSNVFESKVRPPTLHSELLRKMAPSFSARAISSIKSSGDINQDLALWEATMQEVKLGFIEGPYRKESLPKDAIVSPRFGLQQKSKLRPIDNFTASGVNNTVGLSERLRVDSIHDCAASIKRWMQMAGGGCELVGRTYDLKKAYRQLGVAERDLDCAWIGTWSPSDGQPMFFRMKSLPFGATSAVASFLRVAHSIRSIGTISAALVWSCYFDDYIVICRPRDAASTDMTVKHMFGALGWQLSEDDKDAPFSKVFSALGVTFDLTHCQEGYFEIGNTTSRKEELSNRLDSILAGDELTPQESMSMRSRFMFAESQVFGRVAKLALTAVSQPSLMSKAAKPLGDNLVFHLRWLKHRVLDAPPRRISATPRTTYYLFLDGACTEPKADEWSGTSIGGIMFDEQGRGVGCFGEVLGDDITAKWSGDGRTQLVFEAEVMPYVVALKVWGHILKSSCVFVFIDNEAAKASWINANADSHFAKEMVHTGVSMEAGLDVAPFFCRVPTFSNIADEPSRGRFDMCFALGANRVELDQKLLFSCAGLNLD